FVGVTANKSITLMNASVVASQDAAAQSMMLQDYLEAGVEGVTADNLAAVNYAVEQAADGAAGTNPDLASLVAQANAAISALTNATDANALTVDQFAAAGVKGVTVENLAIASASVVAASADDKDSVPDLQTIAEKASALSIIKGYSEGVSGAAVPTAVDYAAAGITHYDSAGTATTISARNIEAINQVMQVSYTDGFTVTDSSSVQAILDSDTAGATSGVKYVSRLGAIEKIAHYASGTETANAPTAADYDAAGIAGVYDSSNNGAVAGTPNNIQAVNMAVRADLAGYMDANTTAEIQVAVSRGRITHYANTNGLDDQATPAPLAAALVPTVADYANVGVTEIYDGSSLVAIDGSNVEQVNDLMAMRYVGDPDTNGDATVDGSDNGRIDVINNATDAATNETNLNYAGTVNTVAEIQNAVAKAMGDKADADDATFGLRVEALDKINAFITAIDGLADKAAYDTYIADSANASAIPTAADYNAAGV
ncbi:hypothetical protein, partial [Roseobacter sp. HKCCA2468]|uniref:hypothetical protein n=1 Tax=Roseobacter sp. HKCCA2468 TaxID=3120342 RepID=UPI0030ECB2F4